MSLFFHRALRFQTQPGLLNGFSMFDIQSISLFPFIFPSLGLCLLSSVAPLPPLWVSYIYFSEVFLIWHESRPGRFSPWLQLLSQLLSPAGAALCWVLSSIWGPISVCACLCVYVCVYVCLAHMILSSWSWVPGSQIGVCLLLIHDTGTDLLRSAVRQLLTQRGRRLFCLSAVLVPVTCIKPLALKPTLITH